jgi:hypothetical protein
MTGQEKGDLLIQVTVRGKRFTVCTEIAIILGAVRFTICGGHLRYKRYDDTGLTVYCTQIQP